MASGWDEEKDRSNLAKHGLTFEQAQKAFFDPHRVILEDERHSAGERRFFCIGLVEGLVATVRYTIREDRISILGAGYWRVVKRLYYREES